MLSYIVILYLSLIVNCDEHTHKYAEKDQVILWMNTVGPYHNLQETYQYFSLPFCQGPNLKMDHYHETLAEELQGIELELSGLHIPFRQNIAKTSFCTSKLTDDGALQLGTAIANQYWYQMYIDDLPIRGVIGELRGKDAFLWTHKKFEIFYNHDQIINVVMTSGDPFLVVPSTIISFTYEVIWKETTESFAQRFDRYLDTDFFHHRIHWFSIFNSFMMVIFLVALVSMILLRTLRKDYARYNKEDALEDLERELGDEYGWKQVHGDVFRPPFGAMYFASLIGTGLHIVLVSVTVTSLAFIGKMYMERGSLLTTVIFIYTTFSPVNGFFGGRIFSRMGGKNWILQMFLGSMLLPSVLCIVAFGVNTLAIFYHTSRSLPFLTMLAVFSIITFAILPLNLVGTIIGRNVGGPPSQPCRVNPVPRSIPDKKWYTKPLAICLFGGILPFGSIFIEMYFIFTSFWAYKVYFVYGFTLLVICILIVVTACVSIVSTYFLLNAEDYRWQWISFGAGASTSIYVYLYSVYYFLFKTKMFGLFQTLFYFGYMAFFCFTLGCMCGSIGYLASSRFVKKIYSTVKID